MTRPRPLTLHVALALLAALALDAVLLPEPLSLWGPHWLFLTLGFWAINRPGEVRFELAWGFGLLQDLAVGVWLGAHVLSYSFVLYFWARLYRYILHASLLHHALFTLLLLALHLAYLHLLLALMLQAPPLPQHWRSFAGSAAVALPWFALLGYWNRRLRPA